MRARGEEESWTGRGRLNTPRELCASANETLGFVLDIAALVPTDWV